MKRMMKRMRMIPGSVLAGWLTAAAPAGAQQTLELWGHGWTVTATDAAVEDYLGRRALRLRSGAAVLTDVTFENGVIEYDVATTGHRSFVGVAFRLREEPRVAYEHFYLRPHQTGRFDAPWISPSKSGSTSGSWCPAGAWRPGWEMERNRFWWSRASGWARCREEWL
jgi:hypothetical protein